MPETHSAIDVISLFSTKLGWMALVGRGEAVRRLVFGYVSPDEVMGAIAAADDDCVAQARIGRWNPQLVARLKAFARGTADDFRDVKIDVGPRTEFQRRVIAACRRIGYGRTLSYAQLAQSAGYPRAARAVGSVMSSNRVPFIVPCHRVLGAGGRLGGYSCRLGLEMKSRLLELESADVAAAAKRSVRGQRRTTTARG